MGCGSRAWLALMRRNMTYRRRYWLGTILEILLPPLFAFFLVLIKNAVDNSGSLGAEIVNATFPDYSFTPLSFTDYITAMRAKRVCVKASNFSIPAFPGYDGYSAEATNGLDISGILDDGFNWQVPFVKCDSRKCDFEGQDALPFCEFAILAIAGSDAGGQERAEACAQWIYSTYPMVVPSHPNYSLPFNFPLVKLFNSSKGIDDYVKSPDYGRIEMPKIAVGVVWQGNDLKAYNYSLRQNSTNFNSPEDDGRYAVQTTPPTGTWVDSYAKEDNSCTPLDGSALLGPFGLSCTGQYMYNGVITIQRLVHDFILDISGAAAAGYTVGEAAVQFTPFPSKAYKDDGFYANIGDFAPLLIMLGFLYPVSSMISYLCKEKELRQKELMKMMSVTESDIGGSWFCTFMIVNFISATISAIITIALFENSDGFLLWIFWIVTMIGLTVFCMAISSLTSMSIRGVLIGILVTFGGVFLTLAVDATTANVGLTQLVSLLPITAFSYGIGQIGLLEDIGFGLTPDTLSFSENKSGYSFQNTLQILIFDCILWGFVSWYLNRVIKPNYGQALPLYFPFSSKYWCPGNVRAPVSNESVTEKILRSGIPYEEVGDNLKRQADEGKSIEIHDLRKAFGDKCAVDGLNLTMYSGQITALLGHNGAGKTTTINMLTGAMGPTNGYATVVGKDIRTDLQAIRKDIGICLQHDCLFPDLTVREHLQFFARLKGLYRQMSKVDTEAHIDQAIRDVALFEKRNTPSKNLSGGQKRKLSVAIAFCGGSKVVLLDEPTSGMDPFSRRFTWNVIRQYRQDRCIILTTHFMDEADILGDRIAIMAEGHLRCAGSSLFLKKMYGVGYQLTIEKNVLGHPKNVELNQRSLDKGCVVSEVLTVPLTQDDEAQTRVFFDVDDDIFEEKPMGNGLTNSTLISLVKCSVPEATLLHDFGTEVRYQLPIGSSDKFSAMFEKLDHEVDEGNIISYGVSITTLEEVFLLVARGDSTPESKKQLASSRLLTIDEATLLSNEDEKSVRSRMDLENESLFFRHLNALFRKRALNFQRDKKAWCCTTILPIVATLIGFIIFLVASPDRDLSPVTLELSRFNPDVAAPPINPVAVNSPDNPYTCQPGTCSYYPIIASQETSEIYTYCGTQANLGVSVADTDIDVGKYLCNIEKSTDILRLLDGFEGAVSIETQSETILDSSKSLDFTSNSYTSTQYGAVWYTREPESTIFGSANGTFVESIESQCRTFVQNGLNYTSEEDCLRFRGYGYVIQYNFTGLHVGPLFQSIADQALLRYATGNGEITISTTIAPLPITLLEERYGAAEDLLLVWFMIMFVFPFIAASFASFLVVERESKAKHLQTVAGVEPTAYWISTFLWDTMNYQLPLWFIVILMFVFKVNALTTTSRNTFSGVLATLFFYGPASAGFAYCCSFAFKSPSLCFVFLIVSGIIIGFGGPLTVFILLIIGTDPDQPKDSLVDVANILTWVLRFFPSFCLGKGLLFSINADTVAYIEGDSESNVSVWSEPFLLVDVIFLVVETFGYTGLAICLDIWSSNPRIMSYWNSFLGLLTCNCFCHRDTGPDITTALPDDDDVLNEQNHVLSGGANSDLIVISQLSKVYANGKIAVNNLSLGIPHGECFGLLGINGAGKTTTLQMLTAEFPPTSGDATLAGFSISKEPQKTRRRIGYCPQFDAHFAQLTGRNHVELYASIKGIPTAFVKEAAALKLKEVGLSEYDSDRLCVNYSGGMRRRLSLACATIGQPQIIFLDECSTGVDPVARREIWQLISDMVSNGKEDERASVILTTHSMEECEALCPRIGIMANGRLRCLGSAQHLKNKFGQGYQLELKTKIVDHTDDDYIHNANVLAGFLSEGAVADVDESAIAATDVCFTEEQAKGALAQLTNDTFLSSTLVNDPNSVGFGIWKDASSPVGVTLDALAAFATIELRMRNISNFVTERFPAHVLRERQDTKARYEVSAQGLRISAIFAAVEETKDALRLADYGVSQTSLEQVFNMHAAEAEKLKQGRDDR